jgi:excinuclease ABC subunit C
MECFDISHTRGELTVASCVVFDAEGPRKSDYRRFNIEGITPGDDYAAMEQALSRRYKRVQKGEVPMPDLLFIDGGKGQLGAVREALAELGVTGLQLVGVAKGPDRRPGAEQLWLPERRQPIIPGPDSPALHLVQQIRDEAHRFAITYHRRERSRGALESALDGVPGIGRQRKAMLLKHFGGIQKIRAASLEELASLPGMTVKTAAALQQALGAASG